MSSDVDLLLVRPHQNRGLSLIAGICCEPLELEQLATVAGQAEIRWAIYDPLVDHRSLRRLLKQTKPRLVAITGYHPMRPAMLDLSRRIRVLSPGVVLVAGGVDVALDPDAYTQSDFDVLVYHGGAVTFQRLLAKWRRTGNVAHVQGTLHHQRDGGWIRHAALAVDSTALPPPDRSHFLQHRSRFNYLDYGPVALLKSAYGCPYDCRFCCCKLLNDGRYAARPVKAVVDELEHLPTDTIWIVDDTFLTDMARVEALAVELERRGIRKQLIIYARAGEVVREAASLPRLRQMGIVEMIVGLEAANPDRLVAYKKQASADDNARCVALLRDAGIRCVGLFMVEPDATVSEFRQLRQWIREHRLAIFTVSIFSPFPGTDDFARYRDRICTDNPCHWDLRHLVMRPTHMGRLAFYWRFYALSAGILRNRGLVWRMLASRFRWRWRCEA